ncbi:hypothetical protein FQN51_001332 [Onygenales sp. PD_10]|nr:hypothetical protein FQN51_001332 [Onygenales sp. PD_10]
MNSFLIWLSGTPPSENADGHPLHDQSGPVDEVGESASEDEADGTTSERCRTKILTPRSHSTSSIPLKINVKTR